MHDAAGSFRDAMIVEKGMVLAGRHRDQVWLASRGIAPGRTP
ncbi:MULTISPECIES: hypothetical protein [Alcanivorax]|nr:MULTISPECIES: hypothetical protein [Alcanivorax]